MTHEEPPRRAQMVMLGALAALPDENECHLHKVHNPSVSTLLVHHIFPVDLQVRIQATLASRAEDPDMVLFSGVADDETVLICPTGKMNVDAYIGYLLGEEKPLPVRVGPETKALAAEGVRRYEAALHAAREA